MSAPRVSVLMTAYQRERYIGDAIASVVAQTFTDWELVIVDDGSRDGTVAVAQAWAARDPRIRVERNPANLGDYPNRNHAASFARGEYLRYHDSDDLMYPHCLAAYVQALDAEPRAAFALSSGAAWPGGPVPMLLTPRACYEREFLGQGLFFCGPSCAMFRRGEFEALGRFPLEGVASDYVFWLRACRTRHVLLLGADLFWYRIHPGQELTSPRNRLAGARAMRFAWEALASPECPLDAPGREQARRNWAWAVARTIRQDLRRGHLGTAWIRLAEVGITPLDWVRYLRPASRSLMAGTPVDGAGEPLRPAWLPEGP